jgi:hypothetical protein
MNASLAQGEFVFMFDRLICPPEADTPCKPSEPISRDHPHRPARGRLQPLRPERHTKDVAQIAVPPENRAEHVMKFVERHLIGDRDQADGHRAHLAQIPPKFPCRK